MNPIVSLLTSLTMGVEQAYHKELKRCKELILSLFPFIALLTILCWVIKNTFITSLQNMPRNNIQTWATLLSGILTKWLMTRKITRMASILKTILIGERAESWKLHGWEKTRLPSWCTNISQVIKRK